MASFVYNIWKGGLAEGTYAWDDDGGVSSKTVKIALTEEVLSDPDPVTVTAALTGGKEFDGSYARTVVTGMAVTVDNSGDRAQLDATNNTTVSSVGADAGGQTCTGVLLYIDYAGSTTDSGDGTAIPIAFFDLATAFHGNGSDVTFVWDSVGLITLT